MTGFTIRVEVSDEARQALNVLVERMSNPRPFYQAAGNLLVGSIGENFRRQAAPGGAAWTPLRPATVRARQRRGRSALAILRETGVLAGSIYHEVGDEGVRVGSPVKYAAIHQFGGSIDMPARTGKIYRRQLADGSFGRRFAKRKNKTTVATEIKIGAYRITIPARPFLGLSENDQADIMGLAKRWLEIT